MSSSRSTLVASQPSVLDLQQYCLFLVDDLALVKRSFACTLANANSKQLWATVKSSVNSGFSSHSSEYPLLSDVHVVNDFFANISSFWKSRLPSG